MRAHRPLLLALIVVGLGSLNTLHRGSLLDDRDIFVRRPLLGSVGTWGAVFNPAQRPLKLATFRPVRELSFAMDRAAWGEWLVGWHATSLVVYLAVVAVLWALARGLGLGRSAAFAAVLWFGFHAAHSEALGWLKNRGELLSALFGLTCLLACRRGGEGWACAAMLCMAAAMGSMETAVAYAGVALAAGLLAQRGEGWAGLRTAVLVAGVAGGALVLQAYVLSDTSRPNTPTLALVTSPGIVLELAARYAHILAVPARTCIDAACGVGASAWQVLALAAVVAIALASLRRGGRAYAAALTLAPLALVSLVLVRDRPVAEHRVFAASAGLALCLGFVVAKAGRSRLRIALVVGAACVMSALSIQRHFLWRNDVRVWREIVVTSPRLPKGRLSLAFAYLRKRLPARGERQLVSGLAEYPQCLRLLNLSPPEAVFRDALRKLQVIRKRMKAAAGADSG